VTADVSYSRDVAPAPTLEAGRLFDGFWHFRRDEALHEAGRLRRMLADRLPGPTLAAVDAVLDRARFLPSTAGEARAQASIRLFAKRLEDSPRSPPCGPSTRSSPTPPPRSW
jgi:hypothetical protein